MRVPGGQCECHGPSASATGPVRVPRAQCECHGPSASARRPCEWALATRGGSTHSDAGVPLALAAWHSDGSGAARPGAGVGYSAGDGVADEALDQQRGFDERVDADAGVDAQVVAQCDRFFRCDVARGTRRER